MHELLIKDSPRMIPFVDEAWQFWFSPFFKLRGLVSSWLPSRAKIAATTTILHK